MPHKNVLFGIIIGLGFTLTQLVLTLYLPTQPALAIAFAQTNQSILFTLTIILTGYTIGQLLWGSISDKIGRHITYITALLLLTPCLFAISTTHSFNTFRVLLFIAGFIVACFTSVGNAYLRDIYDNQQAASIMSTIGIALAIVPSLTPLIASHILTWMNWRAIFYLLTILSFIYLITQFKLNPGTTPPNTHTANTPHHRVIISMLKSPHYINYLSTLGLTFGALMSYYNIAPKFFTTHMHLSITQFGYISIPIGVSYTLGTIIVSYVIKRFQLNHILQYGLKLIIAGAALWLCSTLLHIENLTITIISLCIMMLGVGLTVPTSKIGAMMSFKHNHGTAASIMKASQIGTTLICTSCMSAISTLNSTWSITCFLLILPLLALLIRKTLNQNTPLDPNQQLSVS